MPVGLIYKIPFPIFYRHFSSSIFFFFLTSDLECFFSSLNKTHHITLVQISLYWTQKQPPPQHPTNPCMRESFHRSNTTTFSFTSFT